MLLLRGLLVSFTIYKTYNELEAAEHNQRLRNLSTSGSYIILREQQSYLNIQHDNLAADRLKEIQGSKFLINFTASLCL